MTTLISTGGVPGGYSSERSACLYRLYFSILMLRDFIDPREAAALLAETICLRSAKASGLAHDFPRHPVISEKCLARRSST